MSSLYKLGTASAEDVYKRLAGKVQYEPFDEENWRLKSPQEVEESGCANCLDASSTILDRLGTGELMYMQKPTGEGHAVPIVTDPETQQKKWVELFDNAGVHGPFDNMAALQQSFREIYGYPEDSSTHMLSRDQLSQLTGLPWQQFAQQALSKTGSLFKLGSARMLLPSMLGGAALGSVGGALSDEDHRVRNAIIGGVLGGGVGAGGYGLIRHLRRPSIMGENVGIRIQPKANSGDHMYHEVGPSTAKSLVERVNEYPVMPRAKDAPPGMQVMRKGKNYILEPDVLDKDVAGRMAPAAIYLGKEKLKDPDLLSLIKAQMANLEESRTMSPEGEAALAEFLAKYQKP